LAIIGRRHGPYPRGREGEGQRTSVVLAARQATYVSCRLTKAVPHGILRILTLDDLAAFRAEFETLAA